MIATVDSASSSSAQSAASQTSLDLSTTPDTLGAKAREAMIPCRCSPDVSFAPRKRTNSRRGGRSALCQNLKRLVPTALRAVSLQADDGAERLDRTSLAQWSPTSAVAVAANHQ
jgi:hypothetical protein